MDLGIEGKVAMVAAASKGIGFAAAKALADEGCRVSICSRSEDSLASAFAELGPNARGFVCDVTKEASLQAWFQSTSQELGEPEILVTNTGGPPAGQVFDLSDEQWVAGVEGTLLNVVRMVRIVSPGMQARNWGRIVHVTSLVAKEPAKLLTISSTLRTGLMSLTKLQARELAPFSVTVNGILPGHTLTDRQRHLAEVRAKSESVDFEEAMKRQAEGTAMRRFADPSEIGDVVAFLCSQRASYVSGVSLLVDGATTMAIG